MHTNNAIVYVFNIDIYCACDYIKSNIQDVTRDILVNITKSWRVSVETHLCYWRHQNKHTFKPQNAKKFVDMAGHVIALTSSM